MDIYLEQMIGDCDLKIGKRLSNVLNIRNLIEVRNDFEMRLRNYFN
jgi:hypothetical protein